jgi:hypothetical protein
MIPTELHTRDIPAIFGRFAEVIGESHWVKRARTIGQDGRGNPHLREYLVRQNDVALALNHYSDLVRRYGQIPPERLNDRALYPAIQFATQSLGLIDSAPPRVKHALVRRIHGAFRNPDDMRAMQLEAAVATHFIKRGNTVQWPELEGTATYDLTVLGLNADGLEVECKHCSIDKGRKIHRREALDSVELIRRKLEGAARNLHSGLSVVLTIPDRLPRDFKSRNHLMMEAAAAVVSGQNATLSDGSDIRIADFDLAEYPDLGPPFSPELREAVDKITSTANAQTMILGRRNGGALVFALQSKRDDSVLGYVFDTAADAARRQLSKNRAGLIVVGFEDITPAQLVEIGRDDQLPGSVPSALRVAVSHFLASDERSHLIGATFTSEEVLEDRGPNEATSSGTAYYFPRKEGPYWSPAFSDLFAP